MFGFLKKKENKADEVICSPVKGKAIASKDINDPTFSEEMLGRGFAIIPEAEEVYAPCDGEIALVFETKHAISLVSDNGAEIMIHMGLDTVKLGGQFFEILTEVGKKVKKGDLIAKAEFSKIKEAGYDTVIPIILLNTDDFAKVDTDTDKAVEAGDEIMYLKK